MGKTVKKLAVIAAGIGLIVATGGTLAAPTLFGSSFFGVLVVSVGSGLALSGVSGLVGKMPKISAADLGSRLQLQTDPNAPRMICYGQASTGGVLVYREPAGSNSEDLYVMIALAGHEVESIVSVKWGGETVAWSGNDATGDLSGLMTKEEKLGTDAQAVWGALDTMSTKVTTNHRLRAIAYLGLKLTFDQENMNQFKNVVTEIKGRKLYDSRLDSTNGGTGSHRVTDHSTWTWSDNPALAIADYLMGIRVANSLTTSYDGQIIAGMGVASTRIDWPSVVVAADECEESVSLDGGGSEERYTVNGFIDPRRSHRENLELLASAMGGTVVFQAGKWHVYAAAIRTATKTRDKDDILGPIRLQTKKSRADMANAVRGVYADATDGHQPKDYPPLINATYVTEDGGDELWMDVNLPMTTSGTMAQRLSKIALERSRMQLSTTVTLGHIGLEDQAMDAVLLDHSPLGLSSQKMLIADWQLKFQPDENGNVGMVVEETLVEEADAIYDWTPATDEQAIPATAGIRRVKRNRGQYGVPPVNAGGASVSRSSNPLSASDAGADATIAIAAHSYEYDFGTVSVNSGSITGLLFSTTYFVYFDDARYGGGSVAYIATTTIGDVTGAQSRVYVGTVDTPADGGGDTSGRGGGGGRLEP